MSATTDVQIPLSSDAYLSPTFDATFDTFRSRMPEGFRFNITASWQNPSVGSPVVRTAQRDEALAREIVAALEAGA